MNNIKEYLKKRLPEPIIKFYRGIRYSSIFKKKENFEIQSWAQQGEDIIIDFVLKNYCGVNKRVKYLDIGANHPQWLSNTYKFYKSNYPCGGAC